MAIHGQYKFSVTIASNDLAVVNCLRSLAQHSQKEGNNRIPWGNTKDSDWKAANNQVTFRFSKPEFRKGYLAEIDRLLPNKLFEVLRTSDNDPATPAKK